MSKTSNTEPHIDDHAKLIGTRILGQIKDELNLIKNPANTQQSIWSLLTIPEQEEILDRCRRRIRYELERGYTEILGNGFPAVRCTLATVTFGTKVIKGTLEIPKGSGHRHELSDQSGQQVLVILADNLDEYLKSMNMIEADTNQGQLDLSDAEQPDDETDEDVERKDLIAAAWQISQLHTGDEFVPLIDLSRWETQVLRDYVQEHTTMLDGMDTELDED